MELVQQGHAHDELDYVIATLHKCATFEKVCLAIGS